ncbi:MAG: hypothetical protein ACYS6W_11590 [Planctomycetota bacterium]|jgi:hypothetical protein
MILGIEIALTLLGIYTLLKRKWPMGKKGYLVGREAKILGILSLITLPVVFLFGLVAGVIIGVIRGPDALTSSPWVGIGIEVAAVISWTALLFLLNAKFGRSGHLISKGESVP